MTSAPIYNFEHLEQKFNSRSVLTIEPLLDFLKEIGSPHQKLPPVIHVAGTNGKGSTIAMLRSIYEMQGYRVHTITSPHLYMITERLVLAGQNVTEKRLWEELKRYELLAQKHHLSWYELIIAVSLKLCTEITADLLLLEVGLGGEFDATNVIESPALSIITPISFDHSDFLGNNLEDIAHAKAGIIKKNCPSLSAHQSHEVESILRETALKKNSDFKIVSLDIKTIPKPNLNGDHQHRNAQLVVEAIRELNGFLPVTNKHIQKGLQNIKWPGRLEHIGILENIPIQFQNVDLETKAELPERMFIREDNDDLQFSKTHSLKEDGYSNVFFDVAHNPDSTKAVRDFFKNRFGEKTLIFALLKSKNAQETIKPLFNTFNYFLFFSPHEKEQYHLASDLAKIVQNLGKEAFIFSTLQEAIDSTKSLNQKDILIAGSHYFSNELVTVLK